MNNSLIIANGIVVEFLDSGECIPTIGVEMWCVSHKVPYVYGRNKMAILPKNSRYCKLLAKTSVKSIWSLISDLPVMSSDDFWEMSYEFSKEMNGR